MKSMSEEGMQANACNCLHDGRDFPWKQEGTTMSKKSVVYVRLDSALKDKAEEILKQLGISPSSAITMFYSEIARSNALPLALRLPPSEEDLSPEELEAELKQRLAKMEQGEYYTQDEMAEIMAREFKSS